MTQTIFPHVIDNTLLKDFRRCPYKAFRGRLQGLKPTTDASIDLHFGKAFALGVEVARRDFYELDMRACDAVDIGLFRALTFYRDDCPPLPQRSPKTAEKLAACLRHYWTVWPLGEDGLTPITHGIEREFCIELPLRHPDDNTPLYYGGKIDMHAHDESSKQVIVDEKTAGSFSDAWIAQWTMDPQMTGYLWASGADHAIIRGVSTGTTPTNLEVPIYRSLYHLQLWEAQMLQDIERMIHLYKKQYNDQSADVWPRTFGNACVDYGRPCEHMGICTSPNPQDVIDANYKVEFWSPLSDAKLTGKDFSTPTDGTTSGVTESDY